ncbi:DUF3368 domain-containing protein [Nostoc sp. C052]|nr:DUF3368 domain-containing protein [Nostoc sp. C052]
MQPQTQHHQLIILLLCQLDHGTGCIQVNQLSVLLHPGTRLISAVKPLLDALINQAGFWVAEPLYKRVLQLVDEN